MERYPTWIRLHPVSIDETLATAVQARIHDPLWLLGRQWQMGELRHDGGATPVDVRIEGLTASIERLRGGAGTSFPIDPRAVPLEALVECEDAPQQGMNDLKLRADAGLHLVRMLRNAGLGTDAELWIQRAAFDLAGPLDDATRDFLDWVEGRVPDGSRLAQLIPDALVAGTPAAAIPLLQSWLAWYAGRFQVPLAAASPTWDPEHLEYVFAVAAPSAAGESVLMAPGYSEPRLDWYSFDAGAGDLGSTGQPRARRHFRIPAPLDFVGMPNARFWTFEEPTSRFDAIDVLARGDPAAATLMVLDFALLYGEDWFLVPIPLEPWVVFEAQSVVVTDCFGDATTLVRPAGRWNVFQLDAGGGALSPLFVHAAPAEALEGPPLEEVHLLRDEIANVAWAVEHIVPTPLGPGKAMRSDERTPEAPSPPGLTWTLTPPSPPAGWFPLLPVEVGRLAVGVLWSARDAKPRGRLLAELRTSDRRLYQEEVPSAGAQVSRRWQTARGVDGTLHFWIGRDKAPRRTHTALGIRFDTVEWK
jgi:hypothetical protein